MHQVFAQIVDYAGLFPPAALGMTPAVREYQAHRQSPERWMLGRFVLAAMRLAEFHETLEHEGIRPDAADPWRLSVVFGNILPNEMALLDAWRAMSPGGGVVVDAIEMRVSTRGQIQVVSRGLPADATHYFEVPQEGPHDRLIGMIAEVGGAAKLRTGGTTPELFPAAASIVSFLQACVAHRVPFKFTAGLHHPFRGRFPLTDQPEAAYHTMYGFVPLLLATAELLADGEAAVAQQMIEADHPRAFQREAEGFRWQGRLYDWETLHRARAAFIGFGSCSFREPVDELGVRT